MSAARSGGGAVVLLAAASMLGPGCVRRVVEITSTPSGALVLLNDREIGRTPTRAEIDHYGRYDVQLRLDGHEPLDGSADAIAPAWDWVGPDLIAEMLPGTYVSENHWHFTLEAWDRDPDAVLERARVFRLRFDGDPAFRPSDPRASLESLGREVEEDDALPGETLSPETSSVPLPGPETAPQSVEQALDRP